MSGFKEIIVKLRTEKGWTQSRLAIELDVAKSTVASWETGARSPVRAMYEQVADLFNVDIDYLYGRTNIRQKIHFDNDGTPYSPTTVAAHARKRVNDEGLTEEQVDDVNKYIEFLKSQGR